MRMWSRGPRALVRWGISAAVAAALAAPIGLTADSRVAALQSAWREGEIAIDGASADWSVFSPFGENVPFSIGLKNDGEFLYVALSSSDPGARMMLATRGLIVWFDPAGGTKKRFGIRYPVIEGGSGAPMRRPGGFGGPGGGRPDPAGVDFDPAKDGRWTRLEVIGPEKDDRRSLLIDLTPGVAVRIGSGDGTLLYELKVPLEKGADRPYAIGAEAGETIGIGLETPEVESGGRRPMLGGLGMGGGGGRSGGMGGGPGRGSGEEFKPPKPIKAWATAKLAAGPR